MSSSPRQPNLPTLAALLGIGDRQLARLRDRGMPMPAPDEDPTAWARRAQAWRRANQQPRRRLSPAQRAARDAAELRWRLARADRAELEVAALRAGLHSQAVCSSEAAARGRDIAEALAGIGTELAPLIAGAGSPEAIKVIVDWAVHARLRALCDRLSAQAGAPPSPPTQHEV